MRLAAELHWATMRRSLLPLLTALVLAGCASLPGIYERPAPVREVPAAPAAPVASAGAPTPAETAPPVAQVDKPAPELAFTAIGGQRHLLSEYRGKFIALVFFAHW